MTCTPNAMEVAASAPKRQLPAPRAGNWRRTVRISARGSVCSSASSVGEERPPALQVAEKQRSKRSWPSDLPRHVAIVPDGNGRWAGARGLPASAGHAGGVEALRRTVAECLRLQIEALTVFAFSAENWGRSEAEVAFLMRLIEATLAGELEKLRQRGVRLRFAGDAARLPPSLRSLLDAAAAATAANRRLTLTVCLGYGAQQDAAAACRELARDVAAGRLAADSITAELLLSRLSTGGLPPLDLLIRPGGERRLSNFLCLESAYAEIVWMESAWPDFGERQLAAALDEYAARQRRFGRRPAAAAGAAAAAGG